MRFPACHVLLASCKTKMRDFTGSPYVEDGKRWSYGLG